MMTTKIEANVFAINDLTNTGVDILSQSIDGDCVFNDMFEIHYFNLIKEMKLKQFEQDFNNCLVTNELSEYDPTIFSWLSSNDIYDIYGLIQDISGFNDIDYGIIENEDEQDYRVDPRNDLDEGICEVSAPTICSTYFVDMNITNVVDVNVFTQEIGRELLHQLFWLYPAAPNYIQYWENTGIAHTIAFSNAVGVITQVKWFPEYHSVLIDYVYTDMILASEKGLNLLDAVITGNYSLVYSSSLPNLITFFKSTSRLLTDFCDILINVMGVYSTPPETQLAFQREVGCLDRYTTFKESELSYVMLFEQDFILFDDVSNVNMHLQEAYTDSMKYAFSESSEIDSGWEWTPSEIVSEGRSTDLICLYRPKVFPQGFFQLLDKEIVMEAIDDIEEEHGLFSNLNETMSSIKEFANKFSALDLDSAVNSVANSPAVKEVKKNCTKGLLSVIAFVASCVNYYHNRSNFNLGLIGVSFGSVIYFTDILNHFEISAKFLQFITDNFGVSDVPEPQSGESFSVGLSALLSTYLHHTSGVDMSKSLIKGLKDLVHVKRGVSEIVDALVIVIESGINYVRRELLGKPDIRLQASISLEIDLFLDSVQEIMDKESITQFFRTKENLLMLQTLRDEGYLLIKNTHRSPKTDGIISTLRSAHNNILKLIKEFEQQNISVDGARQEPIGVLLKGGTGVAKSIVMEHIASAFCGYTLDETQYEAFKQNRKEFIFNHQPENVYFDGYKPTTHVTFIDEIFQIKDIAGKPDGEPMQCIRMLNGFEMSMHMAALENKGHIKFNSKMVIGTTNVKEMRPESIVDTSALVRRFPISVIVCPADEYCADLTLDIWNRKFDFAKLPKECVNGHEITKLLPQHQKFYDSDICGNPVGEPYSFEVLMNRIIQGYEDRKAWHVQNVKSYTDTRNLYRTKRQNIIDQEISVTTPQAGRMAELKKEIVSDGDNVYSVDLMKVYDAISIRYYAMSQWQRMEVAQELQTWLELIYEQDSIPQHFMDRVMIYIADVGVEVAEEAFFNRRMYTDFIDPDTNIYLARGYKARAKLPFRYEDIGRQREFPSLSKSIISGDLISVLEYLKRNASFIKGAFVIGTAILAIPLVTRMVKAIIPSFSTDPQSFSHSDKMRSSSGAKKNRTFGSAAAAKKAVSEPQAGEHDQNGIDIAKSIIGTNLFYLYTASNLEDDFNFVGNVLFVKGRIAIMPYHFINQMLYAVERDPSILERCVKLKKSNNDNPDFRDVELVCTVKDVIMGHDVNHVFSSNDLCLVEFPKQMNEKRNILEYIGENKELDRFEKNIPFVLMNTSGDQLRGIATAQNQIAVCGTDTLDPYIVRSAYSYYGNCIQGSCGSVFFILNPQIPKHKIFGIHVAGNAAHGTGYSAAFTREEIDDLLKEMPEQVDTEEMVNVTPQSGPMKHTQFIHLGISDKKITQGTETSIVKSPIYNSYGFKPLTAPSRLKPFSKHGVVIDPMDSAKDKYVYNKQLIPYDQIETTSDSYYTFLKMYSKRDVVPRLFTWDECLFGIESDSDVTGIKTKSSGGFKLKFEDVDLKKLLNVNKHIPELCEKTVADIVDKVCVYEEMYLNNIRPFWVYIDCLKDERRALEKIRIGKTRLFSACEFYYQILFLKYFGSFLAWMQKNRIDNHCGVGVNPYSLEWHVIAQKLCINNYAGESKVGAGDYSHFDGSANEQIHLAILDVINKWYDDGPTNKHLRYLMWQEIVNSKHVSGNIVYEWNGAMPSGNPATTIINCMYNEFAFRLCWMRMGLDPFVFTNYVYVIFYGDDNVFSVHPKYRGIFNEMSLAKYMDSLGLVYTTELKDTAVVPFRDLSEIEFLKRSFVFDESIRRWIAPLRLDVVLEIPCWTAKSNCLQVTVDNIKCSLRELALYNKDIYEKWRSQIVKAFENNVSQALVSEEFYLSHHEMRKRTFDSDLVFH